MKSRTSRSPDWFPPHAYRFKGGAAPAVSPPPAPTAAPPIVAPAAPPVTTSAPEVTQAAMDAKKQAAQRKGINSTILASANAASAPLGGASATGPIGGAPKNTLLGGG